MVMVVGLRSGKEFVVKDASFFIQTENGTVKQVFISENGNRRIIVDESNIEFYDEPNTQEYLDKMEESIINTTERAKKKEHGDIYG